MIIDAQKGKRKRVSNGSTVDLGNSGKAELPWVWHKRKVDILNSLAPSFLAVC